MSAAPPLSHHEILTLVEPFARRGRHVDLAASRRLERRLVFKPPPGTLSEHLELESLGTGTYRLTRSLTGPGGERATLEAMGPEPGVLLGRMEKIPADEHFRRGPGHVIARSYSLEPPDGRPILTQARLEVPGLRLTLSLSSVRGVAADIALEQISGGKLELPEDLLAVLGWDWTRLVRERSGWKTRLRLRGDAARRSRRAELALDRAAAHLAATLAEPPGRFHDRWRAARWGVVFRRGIPVLTFLALLAALAILRRYVVKPDPGALMLLFHVPTVLIALSFCLQEMAQYEIPPLPRRCAARDWQGPPPAPPGK